MRSQSKLRSILGLGGVMNGDAERTLEHEDSVDATSISHKKIYNFH